MCPVVPIWEIALVRSNSLKHNKLRASVKNKRQLGSRRWAPGLVALSSPNEGFRTLTVAFTLLCVFFSFLMVLVLGFIYSTNFC